MNAMTRREFTLGAVAAAVAAAAPLGLPIGCQTYPVRSLVNKDFPGAMKQLAGMGYQAIEMCSPFSYKADYGFLASMAPAEIKKTIESAGLRCESCHYGFKELKDSLDERIAFARQLGWRQMIVASLGLPKDAKLADWSRAADELNGLGERAHKAGQQLGFHNHHGEFQQLEGKLIYDELLARLNPKLVKLQFQVAVISAGYKGEDFFTRQPGHFISMHLADWSKKENKPVPVGQGEVDWKRLFAAAKKGGVKNYFVEMNLEAMGPSIDYLKKL